MNTTFQVLSHDPVGFDPATLRTRGHYSLNIYIKNKQTNKRCEMLTEEVLYSVHLLSFLQYHFHSVQQSSDDSSLTEASALDLVDKRRTSTVCPAGEEVIEKLPSFLSKTIVDVNKKFVLLKLKKSEVTYKSI